MIINEIKKNIVPGTNIPKPESTGIYKVIGWGHSRGEEALVYSLPKRVTSKKQSTKRITFSDFTASYNELKANGEFSHKWFVENLPICANDGSCNFTTIGGIFIRLGKAKYIKRGLYRYTP